GQPASRAPSGVPHRLCCLVVVHSQRLLQFVHAPNKNIAPQSISTIPVYCPTPSLRRLLLQLYIRRVPALRLHDQVLATIKHNQEVREVPPQNPVTAVGNSESKSLVLHPSIYLRMGVYGECRLLLEFLG